MCCGSFEVGDREAATGGGEWWGYLERAFLRSEGLRCTVKAVSLEVDVEVLESFANNREWAWIRSSGISRLAGYPVR